ncbi:MAG: hypothetical protein IJP11_04300 [Oscillospiraceae bacterium]|nr:hypothetical protein [Oscillospiraceae bacterium]
MEHDELLKRAEDLLSRCERSSVMTATAYLTPAEQAVLTAWAKSRSDCKMVLHGGHPDCERKAAFFLPFYMEEDEFDPSEQFRAIRAVAGFGQPGHRDYMGAILGLGIRRDFLGDIWVSDNTAILFCLPSVEQHLLLSLEKVGRYGVKAAPLPLHEIPAPERKVKRHTFTVQSMRLDAVAAGLFRLSRTQTASLIHAGLVSLNHLPCLHTDAPVREGDVISVRGHGKASVSEVGGQSRKGRLFLSGEIYL